MKRTESFFAIICFSLLLAIVPSCSNDKPADNHVDSVHDTITSQNLNDTMRMRFQRLVSAMPVPFDMLKQFTGAHLPFRGELLNSPQNATSYNRDDQRSINLGIYGADLAYMISQDKLGDAAPYLKSIRQLSDEVVIPSAFDGNMMQRFDNNQNRKDSLQKLVHYSYQKIDSTLQGNDRLILATLVITGGWLEGIYVTTQHIGDEQQNEKNKVLFDMLAGQQIYISNISELLGSFPNDSTCKNLHLDFETLKKSFPKGADIPADQFSRQLNDLRVKVAEIRNRLVSIQ